MEIFSTHGKIKVIDMPVKRIHPYLSKDYACVEFENPDEAEKALKHVDGDQINGQDIATTPVQAPWPRPPPQQFSPPRRMPPSASVWLRSSPQMRRRSRSPRCRSPAHKQSVLLATATIGAALSPILPNKQGYQCSPCNLCPKLSLSLLYLRGSSRRGSLTQTGFKGSCGHTRSSGGF